MPPAQLTLEQRRDAHYLRALDEELVDLGLPATHRAEQGAVQALAYEVDLAGFVNRLCGFWGEYCVPPQARKLLATYNITADQVYFLQGLGTADSPGIVVVPSFDHKVHLVRQGERPPHFQIPAKSAYPDLLDFVNMTASLAGPAPMAHDTHVGDASISFLTMARRFIGGELGAGRFQLDTDADFFRTRTGGPARRRELLGISPADSNPQSGSRVTWDFLAPRADLGRVQSNSRPVQTVTWQLELDLYLKPYSVWRVHFSQGWLPAMRRAQERAERLVATEPQRRASGNQ
ncbi:hypothetical protein JCM3775_001260 [Rhodotorula graminis]